MLRDKLFTTSTWTVVWICGVLAAMAIQMPMALNHDAAWHFETSLRLLGGVQFGKGVADINPPMTAWLLLPVAWIVDTTHVSANVAVKLYAILICSISYLFSLTLLRRERSMHGGWILPATLGGALFIMPAYDFAQREHLVGALAIPYVILAELRASKSSVSWRFATLVGLLAAVGIGIKPHFIMLPFSVESWLLLRARQPRQLLRPELATIVGVGIAYLLAVGVFAPAYYWHVVPDALSNYGGFKAPWAEVAKSAIVYLAFSLCGFGLAVSQNGRLRLPPLAGAMLSAAVGFALAALIQQKGWSYQFYPVALFLLLAAAIALGRDELEYTVRGPRWAAAVFLIALAVTYHTILFMRVGYSSHGPTANVAALTQTFERYAGEDQSVFAFITSPRDIHPAVLASGRAWAGRSGVLMYLPAALNMRKAGSPETAQIRTVARRHNRNRIARLLKLRPAVIAFDNRRDKLGIRDLNRSGFAGGCLA